MPCFSSLHARNAPDPRPTQRVVDCLDGKLEVQASKDCVNKMLKRLQDRCHGRVLGQILYLMQVRGGGWLLWLGGLWCVCVW